jgi:hypothetical protein
MMPTETEHRILMLLDSYGLELLLKQNDIEESTVLLMLSNVGLLDIDDYWYQDLDDDDDGEEEDEDDYYE